jgi:hypothetical protein
MFIYRQRMWYVHRNEFFSRPYAPDSVTILTIYRSNLSGLHASANVPRDRFLSYLVTRAHNGTDAFPLIYVSIMGAGIA